MSSKTIPALLLIDGLLFLLAAIFANALGFDPTESWGLTRTILMIIGVVMFFGAVFLIVIPKNRGLLQPILLSEKMQTAFLLGHLWSLVFVIYVWFITFGNFTTWTNTSRYYYRLADAFSHGQLNVNLDPGKGLLESVDPYDPQTRAVFPDEIWDMSLYKGKLYYYWGPVPALLIAPFQMWLGIRITDNYLVFLFSAGLLIFNSLILLNLWRNYFPRVPAWNVYICIPLMGLILPIVWDASVPYVYEAAVVAGQFFLMAGIYFALGTFRMEGPRHGYSLFLAGSFWACAVGSRAILAVPVVFASLLVTVWIVRYTGPSENRRTRMIELAGLYLPLALGALLICWYNFARFDSPLEFGIRYMITTYNLNERMAEVFHLDYFVLNFFAYFLQPFVLLREFPFLQSVAPSGVLRGLNETRPMLYYAGRITGILFSMPLLLLGLIPLQFDRGREKNRNPSSLSFVIVMLAGVSLIGFLTLLFYFNAQTRFLLDVISPVLLLSILGYWSLGMKASEHWSFQRIFVTVFINGILLYTICVGLLLAVSSETNRIANLNPLLIDAINRFFGFR